MVKKPKEHSMEPRPVLVMGEPEYYCPVCGNNFMRYDCRKNEETEN